MSIKYHFSKIQIFTGLILTFVLLLGFQNCSMPSQVSFASLGSKTSLGSSLQQGGEGFDGKPTPGDYVRTFSDYRCLNEASLSYQALMTVSDTQAKLINDNCKEIDFQTTFSNPDLKFAYYNPDYLSFGKAVFERLENKSVLVTHTTEVFCHYEDEKIGLDAVVKLTLNKTAQFAKIYLGKKISPISITWTSSVVNDFAVSNSKINGQTRYTSNNMKFDLSITDAALNEDIYSGDIAIVIDEQNYNYKTVCRRMSALPALNIDTTGLITYLRFDESNTIMNNQTIFDSSSRSNNPRMNAYTNPALMLTSGKIGNGIPLNTQAQNGYQLLFPASHGASATATVSAWYLYTSVDNNYFNFILDWISTPAWNSVLLGFAGGANGLTAGYPLLSNSSSASYSLNYPATNIWHHIAIVFDTDFVKSYVDGVEVYRVPRVDPTMDILSLRQTLSLGNFYQNGLLPAAAGINNSFIDEISFWNRALTPAEIAIFFSKVVIF